MSDITSRFEAMRHTHGAAGQYVHYLMNMAGASITRNYAAAEERHSGTPWHRDTDVDTA